MTTIDRKEMGNEIYDAALYTGGAFLIGFASRNFLKEGIVTPTNLKYALKLSAAITGGLMGAKFAQSKGWLPTDLFSTKK